MQGGRGRLLVLVISIFYALNSPAQEIKVSGGFLEDSLLIGQDINFWISASYPIELEMIFPDSGHNFSPFEYSSKSYFPSTSADQLAFDSTVYTIQSYEIDLVQYLQLPAIILDGLDTVIIDTPLDSVFFKELAPIVSDTTQLISNTDYQVVHTVFNYPLLYIILGILLFVALILLAIFGKKIVRFFRLRKLRRDYESFSEKLTTYISRLKAKPEADIAEMALITWKKYQEKLENFPFTKLTTREILTGEFNKELEKPLKSIDQLIYGKRLTEMIYQDFQQIEDFTQDRYNKKAEEIRNGK